MPRRGLDLSLNRPLGHRWSAYDLATSSIGKASRSSTPSTAVQEVSDTPDPEHSTDVPEARFGERFRTRLP